MIGHHRRMIDIHKQRVGESARGDLAGVDSEGPRRIDGGRGQHGIVPPASGDPACDLASSAAVFISPNIDRLLLLAAPSVPG